MGFICEAARRPALSSSRGNEKEIEVGVSIGIQPTVDDLLQVIERYVAQGYRRIKVKIKPGWDVDVIRDVRRAFPDVPLMADANSAYTLADAKRLQALDEFGLMMIEQPLAADDLVDHARLQPLLQTPICLDESIRSYDDARKALDLGSCRIINIKIGRVGGLREAKRIHDLCAERGVPVWCGGYAGSRGRARPQYCDHDVGKLRASRRHRRVVPLLGAGYYHAGSRGARRLDPRAERAGHRL